MHADTVDLALAKAGIWANGVARRRRMWALPSRMRRCVARCVQPKYTKSYVRLRKPDCVLSFGLLSRPAVAWCQLRLFPCPNSLLHLKVTHRFCEMEEIERHNDIVRVTCIAQPRKQLSANLRLTRRLRSPVKSPRSCIQMRRRVVLKCADAIFPVASAPCLKRSSAMTAR